jgi:RNA polymerase sigma-70 factor (ECF subfamily)
MTREVAVATAGDQARPTLVELAAEGDEDALAQLIATHDPDMRRVAMVVCGDPDIAREAAQTAWPIAWRKLGSLRDPARLRPWLMSISANQARQMLRSQKRRLAHETMVRGEPGADPADRAELLDLGAAVRKLSFEDRRLIGLRYVAGLTSDEIARELGGSAASVRGRIARTVHRLRKELADA